MRITVKIDIPVDQILADRGLGPSDAANLFAAEETLRLSEPYTPFQQGALSHGDVAGGHPATITYGTPYAHYQWTGLVMAGRAPKHYTGAALTYSGGGMRGERWTERMKADRMDDLVASVADFVGGHPA